ncbi:D-alanyl-D-alanine carboxypeptidase family protein [Fictibacillus phosphorivorans]|uniref:D-alanyl-D-alanine carboxypeptidase family protein n=1 Tax=Fictibacillus phosphorivorans TaxID=1221500 RepID=UPI0020400A0C|nr:D-alanyl-D-alanine carboxypeptidase family protein [Fictibacillus phosphorivorans]MCM3719397.1 D-alanyl-D-alanine carboxypeptidase [Fictibacillus phosphorivorans]MCM3777125.1 D-alanyl-D-alanine carboxypeptidase [Fictibacillus phosphorivorans]
MKKLSLFLVLSLVFLAHSQFVQAAGGNIPDIQSESAVMIDAKTGDILYQKNSKDQMYPASITKIVTGILAIESGKLEESVIVSDEAAKADGTRVYLLEGEQVPLKKLVQGLLINSGNDAAIAIAEYMAGDVASFADQMNELAHKVGADNTHFVNPNGLFDVDHYTTAEDMAKITQYAMENEVFREIVSTKELPWVGEGWETTLRNHHQLLWDYPGTIGVKNGYVEESKHTLVTAVSRENLDVIIVTLKAPSSRAAYWDTMAIGDYGFSTFERQTLSAGTEIEAVNGETYPLKEDLTVTMPKGEKPIQDVTSDGKLELKNADGEVLLSHGLFNEKKKAKVAGVSKEDPEEPADSTFMQTAVKASIFLYGGLLLLLAFLVILRMRSQRQKHRKMRHVARSYVK